MNPLAEPIERLARALQKLPGIGAKTAQRLALHVLKAPREEVEALSLAMLDAKDKVGICSTCCNLTDRDPCGICTDQGRERGVICVVEEPGNVMVIEKTGKYKGLYHVLHGAISPMHGVGPEQLRIAELVRRLEDGVREVIVATNPNADGEATAVYLSRLIKPREIAVTRIGMGLPVGSELDYADEVTIARALDGRRAV